MKAGGAVCMSLMISCNNEQYSNRALDWCYFVIPNFPIYCCHTELVSLVMRYNNNAFILCAHIDVNKLKIRSGFDKIIFYLTQWFKNLINWRQVCLKIKESLVLTK